MTFKATVSVSSPGVGTPTGTVTFEDGSSVLGTGKLSTVAGVTTATFTTAALGVGSHTITAVYAGDTADATSTSAATTFKVTQDATKTALAAAPTTTVFGQSVTFKATVSVVSPGAGTPTGTVTFKDGSSVLGTGNLSTSSGLTTATFSTAAPGVGSHTITAVYAGDTDDVTSTSAAATFSVTQDVTKTTLAAAPTTTVYGQSETFTATVAVVTPGVGTPTGTVTFEDGTTALGTGKLSTSGGVTTATFTTTKLAVGSHSITAVYSGDTDDAKSTSAATAFKVAQDTTKTALAASPTSSAYGQSVTFTATVSVSSPGAGTPTGTVTFKDGSSVLGTGSLATSGGVTAATFTTTKLGVGSHTITAVYAGDTDDVTSTSAATTITVQKSIVQLSTTSLQTAGMASVSPLVQGGGEPAIGGPIVAGTNRAAAPVLGTISPAGVMGSGLVTSSSNSSVTSGGTAKSSPSNPVVAAGVRPGQVDVYWTSAAAEGDAPLPATRSTRMAHDLALATLFPDEDSGTDPLV